MSDKPIYQNKPLYPNLLWQRPVHLYKAEAGKVLVIAGSNQMTGSAILVCEAVFRSGTGILLLGFPESLQKVYKGILPEAMMLPLPETQNATLSQKALAPIQEQSNACDAVILGPGLSQNSETVQLVWQLIFEINKPLVLDDDGLFALIKGLQIIKGKENNAFLADYFKKKVGELVLILDPKEAHKIIQVIKPRELEGIKITESYFEDHKDKIALIISDYLNAIVLLKGPESIICEKNERLVINKSGVGNSIRLASEDVLAGVIGSFISQNPNQIFEACCTAVYLHDLTSIIAAEKNTTRNVLASDIIRFLPEAIKKAETDI